MIIQFCVAALLQTGISLSEGTVGILGYKQSVLSGVVLQVHPGSPVAGLIQKGDRVVAIDGDSNCRDTRGEPGSPVTLTVKRNNQLFDVTVRRVAVQALHSAYLCRYFAVPE